ncbi:MAG: MFS transporter [Chloroflexi bacterium]|nr:MFS transporter [Chloroflexota bacterium]
MLSTFNDRSYRLFFANSLFSDIGHIVFVFTQGWLTLHITDSALWVGVVGGAYGVGILLFSVLGGVLADRLNRKWLLAGAQVAEGAVGLALAGLVAADIVALWHMVLGSVLFGAATSVRLPTRHTLILDLVGRNRLLKGTAASFTSMQVANIAGPLIAGLVLKSVDPAFAYVVVVGAAVIAISSISTITYRKAEREEKRAPLRDMRDGLRYVLKTPAIRALLLLAVVVEAFAWSHEWLLPVVAEDVLRIGPDGLGYMMSIAAAGAVAGTLVISSVKEFERRGRFLIIAVGTFAVLLAGFSFSRWFPVSALLLALAYGAAVAYETVLSTIIQTSVPQGMRGRVLSLQTATWGLTGIGGFMMGAVATALSVPLAISIGAGVVLLNALRLIPIASRFDKKEPDASAVVTTQVKTTL